MTPMARTTYFTLKGQFLKEDEAGDFVLVTGEEMEPLIEHVLHALNVYADHGFRFVDVDSIGTLTTGDVEFAWSDYGLGGEGDHERSG